LRKNIKCPLLTMELSRKQNLPVPHTAEYLWVTIIYINQLKRQMHTDFLTVVIEEDQS